MDGPLSMASPKIKKRKALRLDGKEKKTVYIKGRSRQYRPYQSPPPTYPPLSSAITNTDPISAAAASSASASRNQPRDVADAALTKHPQVARPSPPATQASIAARWLAPSRHPPRRSPGVSPHAACAWQANEQRRELERVQPRRRMPSRGAVPRPHARRLPDPALRRADPLVPVRRAGGVGGRVASVAACLRCWRAGGRGIWGGGLVSAISAGAVCARWGLASWEGDAWVA
ncbi:hypothetical protein F4780DRAFT_727121 [Xylariomycetidae sp. FL0641]|nr:hypothetical protein F4780DRAFT_727121 [Xylariomycetidae sp. FL0641]